MRLTYNPAIFETADMAAAREIILTSEAEIRSDERWERETPYLVDLLGGAMGLRPGQLVVDYGCGVGRLSKALIERFGCAVIGVDISTAMRRLAVDYVASEDFTVMSRDALNAAARHGLRADAAICVWVLQHCHEPATDVGLLRRSLISGAPLGVVNNLSRAVPVVERRWANDGLDVRALLAAEFEMVTSGVLDAGAVGARIAAHTFWGVYR